MEIENKGGFSIRLLRVAYSMCIVHSGVGTLESINHILSAQRISLSVHPSVRPVRTPWSASQPSGANRRPWYPRHSKKVQTEVPPRTL